MARGMVVRREEYELFAGMMREFEPDYRWWVGEYLWQRQRRTGWNHRGPDRGVLGTRAGGRTPGPLGLG
jgi:hypothetical protein